MGKMESTCDHAQLKYAGLEQEQVRLQFHLLGYSACSQLKVFRMMVWKTLESSQSSRVSWWIVQNFNLADYQLQYSLCLIVELSYMTVSEYKNHCQYSPQGQTFVYQDLIRCPMQERHYQYWPYKTYAYFLNYQWRGRL